MAMGAPDHPIAARGAFDQVRHQSAELRRDGVSGRIRHLDDSSARADHFAKYLDQKLRIAARRVLGRELDIVGKPFGVAHGFNGSFENLLAVHAKFVFQVDIGSRDESVDAWMSRMLDCFQRTLNVGLLGAREAYDARTANFFTDSAHRIEIAVRRRGKAGFNHVDAELFQLARDDDFLFSGHARARRLLAVTQRGVENLYYVLVVHFTISSMFESVGSPRNKTPAAGPTGVSIYF